MPGRIDSILVLRAAYVKDKLPKKSRSKRYMKLEHDLASVFVMISPIYLLTN